MAITKLVADSITSGAIANTPAFFAYRSGSNQTFTDDVNTVMQFNSEEFDTDNCYNTSTYRFTPNVAGKYLIGFSLDILGQQNQIINTSGYLNKNGSAHRFFAFYDTYPNNYGSRVGGRGDCIVEMNGSTDYVDVSIYVNVVGGTSAPYISDNSANNSEPRSFFYGYKIIE